VSEPAPLRVRAVSRVDVVPAQNRLVQALLVSGDGGRRAVGEGSEEGENARKVGSNLGGGGGVVVGREALVGEDGEGTRSGGDEEVEEVGASGGGGGGVEGESAGGSGEGGKVEVGGELGASEEVPSENNVLGKEGREDGVRGRREEEERGGRRQGGGDGRTSSSTQFRQRTWKAVQPSFSAAA